MIVTFIGHGKLSFDDRLKAKAVEAIENCIKSGADTFYLGHCGQFDIFCAQAIKVLKAKYPSTKLFYITPYITQGYQKNLRFIKDQKLYDDIIYPKIESVPYRFAISKRNEFMIDAAAVIIAFVNHSWGGAYSSLRYAVRKNKTIINLS